VFNHIECEIPDLVKVTGKDGKRYYTTPDGDRFPSVTTVIGAASSKKQIILDWRKRVGEEEANRITRVSSGRGTGLHKLCERYLGNEQTIGKGIMPDALEMFRSIQPFINRINNIHALEKALWSKQLKLAGTTDCIAEFDGVLSVIDFKNSRRIKDIEDIEDYFFQCAAYALMFEERTGLTVDQLVVIMAVENEKSLLFVQKTEDYIMGLVKAIRFYEAQK
jgi:CRISPR/Cas system-associated exonuclease Cas4 (RecB family)